MSDVTEGVQTKSVKQKQSIPRIYLKSSMVRNVYLNEQMWRFYFIAI